MPAQADESALPEDDTLTCNEQPSIIRLGVLLLLFDVYLTWARIEKQSVPVDSGFLTDSNFGRLAQQPIVFQYMFFRTPPCPPPLHLPGSPDHVS